MSYFLVEIPVLLSDRVDIERAAQTLRTAQSRLAESAIAVRISVAGVIRDDGRLVCLIEAEVIEAVRSLVTLALLPAARIREVLCLTLPGASCGTSDG